MLMIQNRTRSEISPYHEPDSSSFTQTANIILTVLLCVLVLTAAIGNGILIFVVVHSKDQRHQSDFFIVSLASADFLMCVIVFPISMTYQLEGSWRFGKTACKLWIVLDVAFSAVAIYTMSAICMNVCFHVRRSFVTIYEFAQRRTHEVNAMIWVFAFLIATIPLIFDYELTDLGNDYAVCMFNEPPAHAVTVSAIVFFIPTTWSFFLYAELMTTYVNVMKLKRSRIDPEDMTVEQRGLFTVSPHINAILTMGIKLTIYLLCWMPYFVVKVVHAFCQTCEHPVANKVAVWLPYVSSWVSPFVYGMLNRRVHDRMKELCPRICWALSTKISPPNDNPSWQNLEQNEPTPTVQNTGSPSKKSSCNKSSEKDSKFENGTTTSNMPLELKGFPANEVPENLLEPPRNTFEGKSKEGYTKHLWKQLATQNMIHKEPYNVYYFCKGDVAKDLSEERDAKGLAYNEFQGPTDRQNAGKIHDEIWHTKQHDVGYHNIQTQYQSYASSSHQSTHKLIENPLGQAEEGAVDQTAVKTMKPRNRRRSFGIGGSTCPATDAVFQARDLHTLAVKQKTAARFSESWMKRFTRQESLKSLNKGLVLPLAVGKPLKLRENGILNFLEPESEDVHEASEKTIPQRRESSVDLSIYSRHTFWTDIDDKSSTFEDFHNDRSLIRPSTLNSTQKTSSSFLSEMNTGQKKKSLRQRSCKQGSDTLQNASRPAERVFDEEAGWGRGHGDLIVRFQDEADFCVNDHPSEGRTLQSSEDENTSDGNTEAEDSFWGTMTVRPRRQKRRRLLAMAKLRSKNRLDLRESAYSSASDSSVLSIGSRPQGLLAFMLLGTDLSASVSNNMVP